MAKITALAARVDEVVVLADGRCAGALPGSCVVRTFASTSRAGRGLRFDRCRWRGSSRGGPRPTAVVAHMCPIYAVLAAPLARPLGVRVVLWFTHWRRSRLLEAAERVSTRCDHRRRALVPAPRRTRSSRSDTGSTSPGLRVRRSGRRAQALWPARARPHLPREGARDGRPGVARVPDVALEIRRPVAHGRGARAPDRARAADRRARRRRPGRRLATPSRGTQVPGAPRRRRRARQQHAPGATDKVVYEAAATCLPVLASNPAFDTPPARRSSASSTATSTTLADGDPPARRRSTATRSVAGCATTSARALGRRVGRSGRRARAGERRVLHVGKVAGISGSENHLLLLLPRAPRPRLGRRGSCCSTRTSPAPRSSRAGSRRAPSRVERRAPRQRCVRPAGVRRASCGERGASGPTSCTRISSTPTSTGCPRAASRACPHSCRTKHGFNAFRDGKAFAAADRTIALARGRARRDLGRAGPLPRRERGLRSSELRDRPLRDRARGPSRRRSRARRGSRSSGA